MDFVSRSDNKGIQGNSGSTYRYVSNLADLTADQAALLRAVDALDSTLMCASVASELLNKDYKTGKVELTANFVPAWKLNNLIPGQPFKVRINAGAWSFTVKAKKGTWKWTAGSLPVNPSLPILMTTTKDEIILFGTRTGVTGATYAAYANKVNSDVFLGYAIGTVLFKSASIDPRQLEDGTMTNDVQISLEARGELWNKDFNEETGLWDIILNPSSQPKFASTAFAGLLT